jgi:hypothetical protein
MEEISFALGFFAGEASFGLKVRQISNGKWYCRPYFSIGLDSKDDEILYQTHELFDCVGSVDLRRNGSVIVWRIESSDDLESFVSRIENNDECSLWRSSEKHSTYSTWKKIVEIYTKNKQTNDQQRVNMVSIAKNEMLNVGAGRQEVDYQKVIDYYADERNVYPETGLN